MSGQLFATRLVRATLLTVLSLSACSSAETPEVPSAERSSEEASSADRSIANEPAPLMLSGQTMGTSWSVQLRVPSVDRTGSDDGAEVIQSLLGEIEQGLLDELQRINGLMSTWDPESELSRFNRSTSTSAQTLSADTLHVIDTARTVSYLTDGRYDITLAPLIDLWGFGSEGAGDTPGDEQVRQALASTGSRQLVRIGKTVRKRLPQVRLDLSSLAKGYAVDQLGVVLEQFAVTDYLAEIGGEIRARGYRAPSEPWKVGIETPEGQVVEGLALVDAHVASSGSYRNYREEAGKRLSHIIDGRTGRPIDHALVAVTVVHESTMLADAWATALLVVGEADARELARNLGLAVQLTVRVPGGFDVYRTPTFSELLLESA